MVMRIVGGCSAALFASFALIIFGLEMSIAITGPGANPSAGIARKGDRLVPALYRDAAKKPPDIGVPNAPASSPAIYDGCELLVSSLVLPQSGHIAARCLS
jgi:hypothetical protein